MMHVNHDIARQVIDRISVGLNKPMSVTDATGCVLASTRTAIVGTHLECARAAIATHTLCSAVTDDGELLSLPLAHAEIIVGALVLDGGVLSR